MFTKLFILLLANLAYSCHGSPLELKAQHDMREFVDNRIVGGVEAPPEYGRHMAALIYGEIMTHLMCGGSIITNYHILTAAHCIEPLIIWGQLMRSFRAVIGSNKWASTENSVGFKAHITHPGFSWRTLKDDIGVLVVSKEIKSSENVAIIPMHFDWVDGNARCFVAGWGRTEAMGPLPDKLQMLYVSTLTSKQCFEGIEKASAGWHSVPEHDPNLEICTLHSFGHGMCNGDSGSALVLKKYWKLIGVVSWGFPCALGAPDVYVRISAYKDWLSSTLKDIVVE